MTSPTFTGGAVAALVSAFVLIVWFLRDSKDFPASLLDSRSLEPMTK